MRITAVVLDMDGLMLDTEPLYKAAWQRASEELGFQLDDHFYSTLVGRPTKDCEAQLVRHFGEGFPLGRFATRWPDLWKALARARGIHRKPGLLALLAFLEEARLPTAVATSSDAGYTTFSLQQAGLAGRFDLIVTGDQVAHGKPAPDIYLEAARRLGQHPADCVALEDSDAGVLSASAAGMITLSVPDLKEPSQAAAHAARLVCRSLDEARDWIAERLPGRSAPSS